MTEVRVLDETGKLISNTTRCGHIRKLLKTNQAKVVNKTPFTVQLLYKTDTVGKPIDRKDNNIMDTFSVFSPVDGNSQDGHSSILSENLTHCIIAGDKDTCKLDIAKEIVNNFSEDINTITFILDPKNRWKTNIESSKEESLKINLLSPYDEMDPQEYAFIFARVFCNTYKLGDDDEYELFEAILEAYEFDAPNNYNEISLATIYNIITEIHPEKGRKHPNLVRALSAFKDEDTLVQKTLFSHQGDDLGNFILKTASQVICNNSNDEKHHGIIVFNSGSLSGNAAHLYFSLLSVYISELIKKMKNKDDKYKTFVIIDEAEHFLSNSASLVFEPKKNTAIINGAVDDIHFINITNNIDKLPSYVVANSNHIIFTRTKTSLTNNKTAINKILQCSEDIEALSELSEKEYMIIKSHEYYGTIKNI